MKFSRKKSVISAVFVGVSIFQLSLCVSCGSNPTDSTEQDENKQDSVMKNAIVVSALAANTQFIGESFTVDWVNTGSVGTDVKLQLFHGDSLLELLADTIANDSSEMVTISLSHYTLFGADSLYRLKISSSSDSTIFDYTDYFRVSSKSQISSTGQFTITVPVAGETVRVGEPVTLSWSSQYTADYNSTDLYLVKGGQILKKIVRTPDSGSFSWTPDSSLVSGHDYQIYYDHEMYAFGLTTSAYFTIVAKSTVN